MWPALGSALIFLACMLALPGSSLGSDEETAGTTAGTEGEYMGADLCSECHEAHATQISYSKHGQAADARTPSAGLGCEACHGPGETHVINISEGETELGAMLSYRGKEPAQVENQNRSCLQCHKGESLMHWETSVHQHENLACTSCHQVHKPSKVLERTTQIEVCNGCHKTVRAQTYRASTHPIQAGKTICSDCHSAHGSSGPNALKQLTLNENCYACHAEKRGPYLWEHYPASEDCSLCHRAHGSNHAALLKRQGPQMCQSCHQDMRTSEGRTHINRLYDFDFTDPAGGVAGGTARGRFIVGQNCMNCHSKVHGSNHPSGINLMR